MSMTTSMSVLPGVGSPLRLPPVTNLERTYALDEASNARDSETFDAYQTRATFPDNQVKHPYDILFGNGEFTAVSYTHLTLPTNREV